MGIHGEPGMRRETLRPADAVVDEIMDAIFSEMDRQARRQRRRAGQFAGLDAADGALHNAPPRRAAHRAGGLTLHSSLVGPYCTSLEMAGASITLMHLDDELQSLLEHPCDCAMFQVAAK